MKKFVFALFTISLIAVSCKKKLDFDKSFFDVEEFLKCKEAKVKCDEVSSLEGQEITIAGKLNPDWEDKLNSYSPLYPDTWGVGFFILDNKLEDEFDLTKEKIFNTISMDIMLYNDGINVSSFEPLVIELNALLPNKEYKRMKVTGIVRGVKAFTNFKCKRGLYLEINSIDDVQFY